jgi:hypothetical protein
MCVCLLQGPSQLNSSAILIQALSCRRLPWVSLSLRHPNATLARRNWKVCARTRTIPVMLHGD